MRLGIMAAALLSISPGCRNDSTSPGEARALVIAHRGASWEAPEHTSAAYEIALDQGADYIELDVARTRDGVLVVIHDASGDRTLTGASSSCTGRVADRTLAELKSCDAGSWFNSAHPARAKPAYAALRILTVAEALDAYASRARFHIEIKDPDLYPAIETDLAMLLESKGIGGDEAAGLPRVYIQSFQPASLRRFRDRSPEIPLVLLIGDATAGQIIASLDSIAEIADVIGPARQSVNSTLLGAAHERCLAVHVYTVNDEQEMQSLLAMEVDGIFTDRPGLLRRAVDNGGTPSHATRCSKQ